MSKIEPLGGTWDATAALNCALEETDPQDQIPYSCSHADSRLIAYAIEAKLKEKNT